MPDKSNNSLNFWQELKRRKVFRVVAMYAAAAYVIIELSNNVVEPLSLPDWTPTFIIVLLVIGFPFAVIFSWIFDFTPEGIKKTESAKVAKQKETPTKPAKRKLGVSEVIIAVLVVIVVILAYPRVFKRGTNLKAMTITATIVNEFGEKEMRQVFKEEYVHKLMILPFEPEETDSINNWLKYGIQFGISEDSWQFPYVLTYYDRDAAHLQEQINAARINNCPYFLTGIYKVTDGYYRITSRLHQTQNGAVEKERVYEGNDLFCLLDSISLQTRIDLGIPKDILNSFPDLPFQEYFTDNFDAYKYFILGEYYEKLSTRFYYYNFSKALELDSTFAIASLYYAWYCHWYQGSKYYAQKYISHAMRHRQKLPEYYDIQIRSYNYLILGETEKAIALAEMQHELQPYNIYVLKNLIEVFGINFLIAKTEDALKRLNELAPDYPEYQIQLARSYLLSDKIDEGLKFIEKRIEENPKHTGLLLRKGQLLLHKGDLDNAEKAFQNAILISPENEKQWSLMLDHINYARNKTLKPDDLQKLAGKYRVDGSELYFETVIHNDNLFRKAANQGGLFHYPISDTSFAGDYGNISFSFYINSQGKVSKLINKDYNFNITSTLWKLDSLIIRAEELLELNKHQEALIAFQKAYSENPEHYYLANYIKHLEFIQSEDYEKSKSILESCIGDYGAAEISKEKNLFFAKEPSSLYFKILPLSEDQFMNPSRYFLILKIVKEDNQIRGINVILNNGNEFFFERTVKKALASQNQ